MNDKRVELNKQSQEVIDIVTNDSRAYSSMISYLRDYKDGGAWSRLCRGMKNTINPCMKRSGSDNLRLFATKGYAYMKENKANKVDNLDHLVNALLHYYSEEVFGFHFTQWCGTNDAPPDGKTAYQDNATKYAKELTTKKETKVMRIEITKKTFINGTDITTMTDDALFAKLAQAEAEVKELEAIEAKPKKLVARIKEVKQSIADLVKLMDATDK